MEEFIKLLYKHKEIVTISTKIDPELEIAEITDRVFKNNGPALLFTNTGYDFPVATNLFGTQRRLLLALKQKSLSKTQKDVQEIFTALLAPKNTWARKIKSFTSISRLARFAPKKSNSKGRCQDIIIKNPDLDILPILKCWPYDGGKFITLPLVHTINPESGAQNLGMYRMQVFGENVTGMHWHKHKSSARYYDAFKKQNKRMPVSVSLGGNPIYTYAATAPMPDDVSEYMLAGFLNKKAIKLVKCVTNELYVPEDSDFIIEGYVDVNEELILEGPFGDHTGFYSLADFYPKFHVTCITHRKNAIYPATIVGIPPQEDALLGEVTEKLFLPAIKFSICPEILDLHMPVAGVFHNLVIVKIKKMFAGQAHKVINALLGAGQMMFAKMIVVVGEDVNIRDYAELTKSIVQHTDPENDIFISQGPMDVLDHSSTRFAFGGKLGVDATTKLPEEKFNYKPKGKGDEEIGLEVLASFDHGKVDTRLLERGVPALLIFLKNEQLPTLESITNAVYTQFKNSRIEYFVYMDEGAQHLALSDLVWLTLNNMDPKRDVKCYKNQEGVYMHFDGRSKKDSKIFQRAWPNVIVAAKETVDKIDALWPNTGLGEFIPSPSERYRPLVKNEGAVAE